MAEVFGQERTGIGPIFQCELPQFIYKGYAHARAADLAATKTSLIPHQPLCTIATYVHSPLFPRTSFLVSSRGPLTRRACMCVCEYVRECMRVCACERAVWALRAERRVASPHFVLCAIWVACVAVLWSSRRSPGRTTSRAYMPHLVLCA